MLSKHLLEPGCRKKSLSPDSSILEELSTTSNALKGVIFFCLLPLKGENYELPGC